MNSEESSYMRIMRNFILVYLNMEQLFFLCTFVWRWNWWCFTLNAVKMVVIKP